MLDILAIAAHPDDVELAAGGTLLMHRKAGYKTGILDLTRGELGTRGNAELRAQEAAASAQVLGLDARENLGLPDGFFEQSDETLLALIRMIRKYKPGIVLCSAPADRHPDHGRASALVSRACYLSGLRKIASENGGHEQMAYRPAAVYHYVQDRMLKPDLVVDISPVFEQKMEAIRSFKSQFFHPGNNEPETPISGADFLEFVEARAREFGRMINTRYGEGFVTERPAGVKDLLKLL